MSDAPGWVRHWFESGDAILLVIAVLGAETLAMAIVLKNRSVPILVGLCPGLCLALALYASATDADALWIGFWLTASLPAHLMDLRCRLKAAKQP